MWLNTDNITKVWGQMNLAVEYKGDRARIVNVGDSPTTKYLTPSESKRISKTLSQLVCGPAPYPKVDSSSKADALPVRATEDAPR